MLAHSPRIVTENLVLLLDAANPRNFNLTAVEVLVVAGGGGGGSFNGGGGGAGGLIYNSNFAVTPGTQLAATVGNGGVGDGRPGNGASGASGAVGTNGGPSVFGSLEAIGGGVGASYSVRTNGVFGGSGGGSWGSLNFAGGTAGQGNAGGGGYPIGNNYTETAGGGGGAGGNGVNGGTSSNQPGAGGLGLLFNISGNSQFYAAGGAAGANRLGGSALGGSGIGGNGGTTASVAGVAGVPNTGSGGGGAAYNGFPGSSADGGAGGNGIIIVRYPGPQKAIGGTVTSVGGDTIHTFTTSGNFTPLVATNGSAVLGLSDLSGNRNFGKSEGGVLYSSANGGSIVFDGTDDYVDLGSDKVFKTTGGWTVESWVNYDVIPTTYNNTTSPANFIGSETAGTHNSWYWSVLESKLSLWNLSPGVWKHGSTILQAYTWYNAVLVCYNSGTSYQMYLNGIAEGGDHTAYSWNASYSGLTIRYIGRGNSANVRLVDGKIPITKVYDRALSAAEVSQNFNALRGRYGI